MSNNRPFCDARFLPLLVDFDLDQMDRESGTIYGLWPDLTLAYVNPAWTRFALENDGEPAISTEWREGRCIMEAIAEPLRPFFVENFTRCLRESRPWEHTYECSSADVFREFHMTVFPLGTAEAMLVVHSLRLEAPHQGQPLPPLKERYVNEHGVIRQCCHCRRVSRVGEEPVWDWVPDWVRTPYPNTSHGICLSCSGFYYAESRLDAESCVQPFSTSET